MQKPAIIYINGQYLKVSPWTLEAFTPGIFWGKGVFETMLAIGDKVFDVKDHLKRLKGSLKGCKVTSHVIEQVAKSNRLDVARIRVLAWKEGRQIHSMVMALPYQFPTKNIFKACFVKTDRPANSKRAHIKSLDYQLFYKAYQYALAKGFDEALLINQQGYVFEASRSNVFIFQKGILMTPPLSSGCLDGITRRQFIKAAKRIGITVVEKNLTPSMIQEASEIFLTNSLMGIKAIKVMSKNSFPSLPR
jgi:branched-chain amino acid aminotransferase